MKLKLDVHDHMGDRIAQVWDMAAGALLMSLYGKGSTLRYKNQILWLEGSDGEGAESYDNCGMVVNDRLRKVGGHVL